MKAPYGCDLDVWMRNGRERCETGLVVRGGGRLALGRSRWIAQRRNVEIAADGRRRRFRHLPTCASWKTAYREERKLVVVIMEVESKSVLDRLCRPITGDALTDK